VVIRLRDLLSEADTKKDTRYVSGDTYISKEEAKRIYDKMRYDFDFNEFLLGMNTELEHQDVTKGNIVKTAKIAAAHLKEKPNYYTLLKKYIEPKNEDIGGIAGPAPNAPGLVGPGGYIKGAPKPKDVKKTRKMLDLEKRNDN
jgi:hypothetical protein